MANRIEKPPPGSAPPKFLFVGLGSILVGLSAGVVAVMSWTGALQLDTDEVAFAIVLFVFLVLAGSMSLAAWIKLRPRKGVPRVEWTPPDDKVTRFFDSRKFAVTGLVLWLIMLGYAVLSVSVEPSAGTFIFLAVAVWFVAVFGRNTIKPRSERKALSGSRSDHVKSQDSSSDDGDETG